MAKKDHVVYRYKNYEILDKRDKLIVRNNSGDYENHSHFTRKTDKKGALVLGPAKKCIELCDNKRMDIKSDYIMIAVIRLTNDQKYKENLLRKSKNKKQKYVDTSQKNLRR